MQYKDFEKELQELDSRITIVPNPNRSNLANIKLNGTDICPIPMDIRDETDLKYSIELPNGFVVPHRSKRDATDLVKARLELIKTEQGAKDFFGTE